MTSTPFYCCREANVNFIERGETFLKIMLPHVQFQNERMIKNVIGHPIFRTARMALLLERT
jgi:hypothetical protein